MGDTKLLQHRNSEHTLGLFWFVCYRYINGTLDDLFNTEVKMLEGKTLLQILIVFLGVPSFIYGWYFHFADIVNWIDVTKGIILTAIGAFSGIVIGFRQLVRLINEIHDLRKKLKGESEKDQPDGKKNLRA